MRNEKVKPENLTASERSPVIPKIPETEKANAIKENDRRARARIGRKVNRPTAAKDSEKTLPPAEKEKTPEKKAPAPEKGPFPAEGKINKYGFLYFSGDMLAAFGLRKGTEAKLSINLENGALVLRKV